MHVRLFLGAAILSISMAAGAGTTGHGDCSRWVGDYVGGLVPDDTFTGSPSKLRLYVRRQSIGWNVTGEAVPEMILEASHYRCTVTGVSGSFSGSQGLAGKFKLTKRSRLYSFDASDVGNERDASRNFLGYVPNRAVRVSKVK